jgi:hypothetical protein
MVCDDPGTQLNVCGVVIALLSTVTNPEPIVLEVTIIATVPALTVNVLLSPVFEPSVAVIDVEPVVVEVTVPVLEPLVNAPMFLLPVQDDDVNAGFPV